MAGSMVGQFQSGADSAGQHSTLPSRKNVNRVPKEGKDMKKLNFSIVFCLVFVIFA
jgi:hypothetical protein